MEIFPIAFIGGLVGTGLMDIAEILMERLGLISGRSCAGTRAIGRWVLHAFRGQFVHKNIIKAVPVENESTVGKITHYVVGGGLALTYPALYFISGETLPGSHVLPGLLWGLATALLPWIVFYPAFGWGFFGASAPKGTRPFFSPTISHLVYGFGLGIVLSILSQRFSV